MQSTQAFRKCHLQILRSLYDGQDEGKQDGDKNEEVDDNEETSKGGSDCADDGGRTADDDNHSEGPVSSEVWELIEQFLQIDYRPQKELQIHWASINAEAQSRLEYLVSLSPAEEEKQAPAQRLIPRTPLFSVSGRGSTPSRSMSLTPLSSNLNTHKNLLSQNDLEIATTIPSWNFINKMLARRSSLCDKSCESFRSQPFLAQLRDECEMRCNQLRLKTQKHVKREGSSIINAGQKRQKLGVEAVRPFSLRHFFVTGVKTKAPEVVQEKKSAAALDDEQQDSVIEVQMKLSLWRSLFSSVKDIVDEK